MNNLLPDIPRLYTALAEWLACMVYVLALPRRLRGRKLVLCSGAILTGLVAFLVVTGDLPIGFWLPCMAVAVGLMFLLLGACCRVSLMDSAYYCIRHSCWRNSRLRWNGSFIAFSC